MKHNQGFYIDGTPWSMPIKDVRLQHEWTRKGTTLYHAFEEGQAPYWVEVTELGDNQRAIFVTGSRVQVTTLPVNEFLLKFQSLKLIY
jgi:hypothetical protein